MTTKRIRWAIAAAIILMIMTPALGAITKDEAAQSVLPYSKTHDALNIIGPYTYGNHPYYYAEMKTNGSLSGVLIVDGENGEIVTDKNVAEKISYTRAYFENVTPENLAAYNISKDIYTASAIVCKQRADLFKNEIPLYNADEREKLGTIVQSYQETADLFEELAKFFEKNGAVQVDIMSGNASYENAMLLTSQVKEFEEILQKLDKAYDKIMADTNTYYDVLINGAAVYNLNATQLADYKIVSDATMKQEKEIIVTQQIALIEDDKNNTEARVEKDMQLMDELLKKKGIPGFSILAVVCAVLIGGILIQKRRK